MYQKPRLMLHNAMNMGFFMKAQLFTLAFSYYMHTEFEFKYRPIHLRSKD